ncbi:hypothetical protein OIU74_007255 [Salix koriyanagi]|uniref:PGG domain-containing protein n=1 Tax=Salix koriyanagi TaxID=2511006 RepID=A0A9Q0U3C2_9ROSI|nr:hypothetical protein OIU74_007255 [Salix koriyanagi]
MINPLKYIISPTSPPWKTETTGDIRNVMLVGAALIATVTFQAGIAPPGGVWQSDDAEKDTKLDMLFIPIRESLSCSGIYCITPDELVSFRRLFVLVPAPIVIRFVIWVVAFAARRTSTML